MSERQVGGYQLGRKLGQGSFGKVYLGVAVGSKLREEVAVKMESKKAGHASLLAEAKMYSILGGAPGFPQMHWQGVDGDITAIAMDLLGPSLEDLFVLCNRKFSLKTSLMLGDQIINRLEYLHSKNIVHRDIKPDNFVMGTGRKSSIVHLIDFGLASKFRHAKTLEHIQYSENSDLIGTARYASLNTHLGIQQSRRDDIESVGYLLLYFIRGALPWQGLKAATKKEKYRKIMEKKISTPVETLCKGVPEEIASYVAYSRSLFFEEQPDYGTHRGALRELLRRSGADYDLLFDWVDRGRPAVQHDASPGTRASRGASSRRSSTDNSTPGAR